MKPAVTPLRVLILEDNRFDAELVTYELQHAGYQLTYQVVDSEDGYLQHLHENWDLIIADYSLPQFTAVKALRLLQDHRLDIPFIVVTGSISEEVAVDIMKQGAADYLLKDRLVRLGQAVANALEKQRGQIERRLTLLALQASEERFRRLAENAQDVIYRYRLAPTIGLEYISPAVLTVMGYSPEELYTNPDLHVATFYPEDFHLLEQSVRVESEWNKPVTVRLTRRDKKTIWVEFRSSMIFDENRKLIALEGIARDISEHIYRQRELESIIALSTALRTAPDRISLITTIVDQVSRMLQTDVTLLVAKDAKSGDGIIEFSRGLHKDISGERIPAGKGLSGQVMESRQSCFLQNLVDDPRLAWEGLHGEVKVVACVPMLTQQLTIGALLITRNTSIEPHEGRLLVAMADIAANAILRTTLHEKSIQYSQHMATISDIGRVLSEELDFSAIFHRLDLYVHELLQDIGILFISFYNTEEKMFTCEYASIDGVVFPVGDIPPAPLEPPGMGTQSEVIHTLKPVIINNLRDRLKRTQMSITVGIEGPHAQSGLFVPMLARNEIIGVIQVQSITPDRFTEEDADALILIANTAAVAIQNVRLLSDLQKTNVNLSKAYDSTLQGWSRAMDLRDKETEGHTHRVTEITVRLAHRLGINGELLQNIQRGALLHDIGKIGIPDSILLKPGALTDEEREIMKRHPSYAYDLISPIDYLSGSLDIPFSHHEKWDGTGYPRGLKGEEIPLAARIFAVVDVWDALCSDRPYRPAWDKERVISYIQEESGKHFDPRIVEEFLKVIN